MDKFGVLISELVKLDNLLILALFYWVEAAMISYLGMALLGFRMTLPQTLKVGICQGVMIHVIFHFFKTFGLPLGVKPLVLTLTMTLFIVLFTKARPGHAFSGSMLGLAFLLLSEFILFEPMYKLAGLNPDEVLFKRPLIHSLMGHLLDMILYIITLIVAYFRFSLVDYRNFERDLEL